MGNINNSYLNIIRQYLDVYLKVTILSKSDAEIIFSPMCGHFDNYSIKSI